MGPHEGISVFMREKKKRERPELSFSLPWERRNMGEKTARRQLSAIWEEVLTGIQPHWHLGLGFLASRTVRINCLLLQPPSLWHFVLAAHAD